MTDAGISYRSGPGWHVAYTEPRAEHTARREIEALGFKAYLPQEKISAKRRGREFDSCRPYFPRYLFVAFDADLDAWARIVDADGVVDVLCNNDRPSRIPTAWIEALRRSETIGDLDLTKATPFGFEVNEQVRVADGIFAGHQALITEFIAKMRSTTAKKRARVLVNFLGRMTEVELPVTSLDKL